MISFQTRLRMTYSVLVVSLFLQSICYVISDATPILGHFLWTPRGSTRDSLFCPDYCSQKEQEGDIETCCACSATTCWDLNNQSLRCDANITELGVEFSDVRFTTPSLASPSNTTINTIYTVQLNYNYMQSMPVNMCDFPSLFLIDFSHNLVLDISNISCVTELHKLDLSFNRITTVSNATFANNSKLRVLNLSNNRLQNVEPNVFLTSSGTILSVDISSNPIEYVDASTVLFEQTFCIRNLSGETFEYTYSSSDWIDEGTVIGPGHLDITNTQISFPNVSELGISVTDISRYYLDGTIFFATSSEIKCDCSIYPLIKNILYWYDAHNITCAEPNPLAGYSFGWILGHRELFDYFTCDIVENCPLRCRCTDVQNQGKVLVNCSGAGLTSFPHEMPIGLWNNYKIELVLSNNSITDIPDRWYTDRLVSLDLSNNPISKIDSNFFERCPQNVQLDISSMEVSSLPYSIRAMNPHSIIFGTSPLTCDCSNTWISDWVNSYSYEGKIDCMVNGRVMSAKFVTDNLLNCVTSTESLWEYILLNLLFVPVITGLVLWRVFEPECLVLRKRVLQRRALKTKYDILISFSKSDDLGPDSQYQARSLMNYILKDVRPALKAAGFRVFVPHLDILGDPLVQTACAIADSNTYLIFCSDEYCSNEDSIFEFSRIWKIFSEQRGRHIVLVNFDGTDIGDVKDRKLKALFRVGKPLDFADHNSRLKDRIVKRCQQLRKKERQNYRPAKIHPNWDNLRLEAI